jgi:hypothetical protein
MSPAKYQSGDKLKHFYIMENYSLLTSSRKCVAYVQSGKIIGHLVEVTPITNDEQLKSVRSYIIIVDDITTIGKSRENSLLYEEWNEYHATPKGENTYEAMGTIWKVIDKE